MGNIIAVSFFSFEKFGCVNCGCDYAYRTGMSGGGTLPVKCGECETEFILLADGITKSSIGISIGNNKFVYPGLQSHPRFNIPKHEYVKPDIRPEGEGEYFRSRGIGYDLAGFVESRQAGQRIINMFTEVLKREPKTWLDYRPHEPNWIQVKIQKEDVNLEKINNLVKKDNIITAQKIRLAQCYKTLVL